MACKRSGVRIPIAPPCDLSGHRNIPEPALGSGDIPFSGCSGRGSGWAAGGLVVAGGVEGEVAEEFAGGGVDDADVEVLDEQQDVGSGVGPADADVVEPAAVAQGDACRSLSMRSVRTRSWVSAAGRRGRLWAGRRRRRRGWPGGAGTVRPLVVVVVGEGVEQGLELGEGGGLGGLGGAAISSGSAGTARPCPGSAGGWACRSSG